MGHVGEPRPQRWLGGRDSWRRIILTGIAGGIALAIVAVLASSVCGGGSGSLDEEEPTVVPGAVDPGSGVDVPADEPADGPTDVPIATEAPVLDTPAPTATEAPVVEPTATTVATPPPTMPPAAETALPPTPEATAKP